MADAFDLESLVHVEQTFYDSGFADGYAHGRIHGLIEGRALGREKGFELWEELGFYDGAARLWHAALAPDSRAAHHATQLRALLARVPRTNPAPNDPAAPDLAALLRQIRSRYKTLCAALGVRASLRAGAGDEDAGERRRKSVWRVEGDPQARDAGLSF